MLGLKGVTKSYGQYKLLKNFDLILPKQGVTCLLGPSGCGKTTLLKILAGLDPDFEGQRLGLDNLRMSFVFQEPRLFPWLSIHDNIKYVISHLMPEEECNDRITTILNQVGLKKHAHTFPNTLSGGMRQRVSLARAFAHPHDILFLDEPFQGLDLELKEQLLNLLEELLKGENKTVVMITHDPLEAKRLGDQIIYLDKQPLQIIKQDMNTKD